MNTTTESVDQVFKVTIDGMVYVLRLVEVGAKAIKTGAPALLHGGIVLGGLLHGKLTGDSKLKGEVSVKSMLRRGTGMAYYMIEESQVPKFHEGAEKTSLLFSISDPIQTQSGKAVREVMVPRDHAPTLNNILHINGINVLKAAEIEQVSATPVQEREEVGKESNHEKNEEFLRRVREQLRERENGPAVRGKPINPPSAARAETIESPSEAKSKDTGSRQNQQQDPREAGNRPGVKEKVEAFKQEAALQPERERPQPDLKQEATGIEK